MRITRYLYASPVMSAFDQYIPDHEKIIESDERRDAPGAGKAMEAHILRAKAILMNFLFLRPGF